MSNEDIGLAPVTGAASHDHDVRQVPQAHVVTEPEVVAPIEAPVEVLGEAAKIKDKSNHHLEWLVIELVRMVKNHRVLLLVVTLATAGFLTGFSEACGHRAYEALTNHK